MLRQIEILGLENLYVSRLDARQFLCCASSGSVSEIFIHFPVPWNSAKNRRVLNAKPLQEVLRVLGDDGYLEFRTDDREYFDDVLSLAKDNAYARATYTINTKQSITSKYEARWLAQDKDIFTITITPKAKPSKVDSRESWQKCAFGFDKKLVKSTLAKVSTQDVLQPNQKHREIFAYLWEKRCFEQGFLCVQDVYVSATRDRVAFLVHFGDFQYPCTRLIVFESNSVDGYAGQYLPEATTSKPRKYAGTQAIYYNIGEYMSIITANNLTLGYQREEPVIIDASFTINNKDFVFISGPSGSGKSTLLSSLYGALTPMSGTLSVCDINLTKHRDSNITRLRQKIGIVFQDYKLIEEWNVEKNITLPMVINGYKKECVRGADRKATFTYRAFAQGDKIPTKA